MSTEAEVFSAREHTIPITRGVRAGNPHLKSDYKLTTAVATQAGDCFVVSITMLPKVSKILARHTLHAHLLRIVPRPVEPSYLTSLLRLKSAIVLDWTGKETHLRNLRVLLQQFG